MVGQLVEVLTAMLIRKIIVPLCPLFAAIPVAVILTKVDEMCSDVSRDVSLVFRSMYIKDCIDIISEKLGILPNAVLPVSALMQC